MFYDVINHHKMVTVDVEKRHKVPEEINIMITETSLDDKLHCPVRSYGHAKECARGPGKSLPESGRHRKDAVLWTAHAVPGIYVFARNQQSLRMGPVLWTAHAVPEKYLPGISRHRKDDAFWTAHALPGNLYLKSAEKASSSTWLFRQTTVSNG